MSNIRERLRKAVDEQRRLTPRQRPAANDAAAQAAFRPVREAAEELADELSHMPEIHLEITPDGVWIELYDKHLWFGYDTTEQAFVGTEQDTEWIEGGLRETPSRWDSAEACIEAMIQACARFVALVEAMNTLRGGR